MELGEVLHSGPQRNIVEDAGAVEVEKPEPRGTTSRGGILRLRENVDGVEVPMDDAGVVHASRHGAELDREGAEPSGGGGGDHGFQFLPARKRREQKNPGESPLRAPLVDEQGTRHGKPGGRKQPERTPFREGGTRRRPPASAIEGRDVPVALQEHGARAEGEPADLPLFVGRLDEFTRVGLEQHRDVEEARPGEPSAFGLVAEEDAAILDHRAPSAAGRTGGGDLPDHSSIPEARRRDRVACHGIDETEVRARGVIRRKRGRKEAGVLVAVTGGTGFVGHHVVHRLLGEGRRVRALARRGSRRRFLEGLPVEIVEGDLLDEASLAALVAGAERVIHCAAVWAPDAAATADLEAVNVGGTESLLRAAERAAVRCFVHVSTIGTIGRRDDGRSADETLTVSLDSRPTRYVASKIRAEEAAIEAARRGLHVVIANAAAPVGSGDARPSVTGRRIVDFLRGRLPDFVRGRIAHVGAGDLAQGILLAAERGRSGERYILMEANLDLEQFLRVLELESGLGRARRSWIDRLLRRPRLAPLDLACSGEKAKRDLGFRATNLQFSARRAIRWFLLHGYA